MVLVGRMGTVWGVRWELRGASLSLVLCQWGYKGSVCEEPDSAPFSPRLSLILSLRKDIKSTDCQSAGGSSFNAPPSSNFLAFTVTPDLFVPSNSAALSLPVVHLSTTQQIYRGSAV